MKEEGGNVKKYIIVTGLFFVSCSHEEAGTDEFNEIVKKNRTPADVPDMETFAPDFDETEIEELPESVVEDMMAPEEKEDVLSSSAMKKDAEALLSVFRYIYGPYEYYGGDETFISAHEDIIQWIDESEEEAEPYEFETVIREAYKFIDDQHLLFEGKNLSPESTNVYSLEDFLLEERDGKYFHEGEEILAINEESPEHMLLPTINEEGELRYMPGIYDTSSGGRWTIETEEETEIITPIQSSSRNHSPENLEKEVTDDEIAVIELGTMILYEEADETYEDMLASVEILEDAEAVVLDLRSNRGGLSGFSLKWLDLAFGDPKSSTEVMTLYTDTTDYLVPHLREVFESQNLVWEEFYEGMGAAPMSSFDTHEEDRRPYYEIQHALENTEADPVDYWENDKPIYVLINELTGSSAEWMLAELLETDNVYVVGLPSAGLVKSDSGIPLFLPHSGLALQMPTNLIAHPYTFNRENKGIEPDLWLGKPDAMERTLTWIRNRHLDE
ncbi:MAG: hypothetical protein EA344_09225 [Alkalicoccus sp.]|nr:MAG: hypothetical protein EA344_09225 [Alkalicoccus sp.]